MGYEFRGYGGQIRVSQKKLDAFKKRVSEIFRRNRGVSMKSRYAKFRSYAMGWLGYFALDQVKTTFMQAWTSGFGDAFELVTGSSGGSRKLD